MSTKDNNASPLPLLLMLCQTDAVKEIMAKVISTRSAKKYAQQNSTFAIFRYKSADLRDLLFEPWFIEQLSTIANGNAKKKYAKECCMSMSPEDINCRFILSNLTFVNFSDFVTQHKARKGKNQGQSMFLGKSSYEQSQSALKRLFRMSKYAMEANFFSSPKQFTKGIRRHVADKKVL